MLSREREHVCVNVENAGTVSIFSFLGSEEGRRVHLSPASRCVAKRQDGCSATTVRKVLKGYPVQPAFTHLRSYCDIASRELLGDTLVGTEGPPLPP